MLKGDINAFPYLNSNVNIYIIWIRYRFVRQAGHMIVIKKNQAIRLASAFKSLTFRDS